MILEMNKEADHIHILFEADPFTAPGTLVNVIKIKTSRYARKQYGDTLLKKYYWKPLFWSDSYFAITVSENNLQLVQEYIKINKKEKGIHPRPCGTQLLWTWYSSRFDRIVLRKARRNQVQNKSGGDVVYAI